MLIKDFIIANWLVRLMRYYAILIIATLAAAVLLLTSLTIALVNKQ
jgi:hypothetical protein